MAKVMCVPILLYMYMSPPTTMYVLILLYMCPRTAIYVSSYFYICVVILIYTSQMIHFCEYAKNGVGSDSCVIFARFTEYLL
jgi:hypothetical protein